MNKDPFENFKKEKSGKDKIERRRMPSDNVGNLSNYFDVPEGGFAAQGQETTPDNAPQNPQGAATSNTSAVKRLEALTELLIRKGVITEQEMVAMLNLLG